MDVKTVLLVAIVASMMSLVFAQQIAQDAVRSGHWTKAEEQEFQSCVSSLHPVPKAGSPESWCEVREEHQHWMHMHPEVAKRKENSARFQKCNRDHAKEVNGTPDQFYTAFDLCMRQAYGLTR